jgi:hypothetical protein
VSNLLAVARREIKDANVKGLSTDAKFLHAYNAALALASIALSASGYKPHKQQSHHLRTIESLAFTIAPSTDFVDDFEAFRAKRHKGVYDVAGAIAKGEADRMLQIARELTDLVIQWLNDNHPELIA